MFNIITLQQLHVIYATYLLILLLGKSICMCVCLLNTCLFHESICHNYMMLNIRPFSVVIIINDESFVILSHLL